MCDNKAKVINTVRIQLPPLRLPRNRFTTYINAQLMFM